MSTTAPSVTASPLATASTLFEPPPNLDVFCDQVFVVDQAIGSFPQTLQWSIYLVNGPNADVESATLKVSGANDGLPVTLESPSNELDFEMGFDEEGVKDAQQFTVTFRGFVEVNLTRRLNYGHEGLHITTNPKYPVVNGPYKRVFSSCPG